ncbi:hypothetical protein [Pseudovibrio denitrificans]|uniref:hypothetical protein n=1 Tax=Pseudovibrio denitrificans TaxID=258256 RepID=UPI000A8F6E44|nr:hypothetical protein [Pseudovibrio denitrificans]
MVKHRFNVIESGPSPDDKTTTDGHQASATHNEDVTISNLSKDALEVAATLRTNTISKSVFDGFMRTADATLIVITGIVAYLSGAALDIPPLWQIFALFEAP